jgi:hypothetical protein
MASVLYGIENGDPSTTVNAVRMATLVCLWGKDSQVEVEKTPLEVMTRLMAQGNCVRYDGSQSKYISGTFDVLESVYLDPKIVSGVGIPCPDHFRITIGETTFKIKTNGHWRVELNMPIVAMRHCGKIEVGFCDRQGNVFPEADFPLRATWIALPPSLHLPMINKYEIVFACGMWGQSALPPFICQHGVAFFSGIPTAEPLDLGYARV